MKSILISAFVFSSLCICSFSMNLHVLPLRDLRDFIWYPSGEICISLWNVYFLWTNGHVAWIEGVNGFLTLMTDKSHVLNIPLLTHKCRQINTATRYWCGYLPANIKVNVKSKLKPIAMDSDIKIYDSENQLLQRTFVHTNISNMDFKKPMSAALTSEELCKHCTETCERTCDSLALGSSLITCIDMNTNDQQKTTKTQLAPVTALETLDTSTVKHKIVTLKQVPFDLMHHVAENRAQMIQSSLLFILFLACQKLFIC